MEHKPIPCPFCGCEWTKIVDVAGTPFHCVECEACGTQGPGRLGMADAIIAWNARHYSPAQAAAPDLLEACRLALEFCKEVHLEKGYDDVEVEYALRQAIAKARGEG